jgi:hypothetical protein
MKVLEPGLAGGLPVVGRLYPIPPADYGSRWRPGPGI